MKKTKRVLALKNRSIYKLLLFMKFTIALLLFTSLQVSAKTYSQDRITLKLQSANLRTALRQIEKKSIYRFLYNDDVVSAHRKVDINANNALVTEVLDGILSETQLTYRVLENNLVVISQKNIELQDTRVSGKVQGPAGEALPGVTVRIKGSAVATATDATGNYSITAPDGATLVFSSVGYLSQEEVVGSRTEINIVLQIAAQDINEVVVIGYGTANRRDLTGSITKVKGDVIAAQPNANPLSSLQAKVAGVTIVNDATPGSTPDVRIRGTVSIGTVRPVYIVDGIFTDNMDFVNPSEIESIEILKDPSSLAVFGVRGAAGAILVTTKKAKAGQTNINFNTSYGSKKLVDKIQLANGDEFRKLATFEANNRVADQASDLSFLNFINNVGTPGLAAFTGNTDWIDAVTRTAKYSTTNLSIDGSSEKNRFHLGLGYMGDEGLVKYVKYERFTINISDEYKISKTFKVGFTFIGSKENLPYNSGALENARRALPIISSDTKQFYTKNPYTKEDSGFYNLYSTTPIIQNSEANPLATLENEWNKRSDTRYRYVGSGFVDINITKDLNFRSTWYANLSNRDNRSYTPLYNVYDPTQPEALQVIGRNNLTAVSQQTENTKSFQQDYIATYRKRLGDHSFTFTGGFTTFYQSYANLQANINQKTLGDGIIPDDPRFWYISTGFGDLTTRTSSSAQNEYTTVSGLARLLYNYKSKYFLTASYRRDGASQVQRVYENQFQNFWAVGAAWEISKEDFMKDVSVVNYLKLKASTGVLGNFNARDIAYPAYPTISNSSSAVFGTTLEPVFTENYLYDPNLQWETVTSSEIGIEANLFNNRLHFEANYYNKKTKDLLVLLNYSGLLPRLTNAGSIQNSGFEFTAAWDQKLSKDLSFGVSGNLTTFKNKVDFLKLRLSGASTSEQSPSQTEVGYPIGYFYGLVVDGIYQSQRDILLSPDNTINGGNAKPGDFKYKDINGDGIISDLDRTVIGNPTPDFAYGFSTNLRYKGFEIGVDFAGVYGNEIFRVWGTSEQKNSVYNYPKNYTEGWTEAGSSNFIPITNAKHLINRAPSTYGIEDGSYFRIRNLNVAYSFGQLSKFKVIKSLKLFASVQNLKTWKRNTGYSPEFSGSATNFGVDYGSAQSALPRITSVGLNVNF